MGLKITTYSTFIYFSQKFFNLQKFNLYCLKAYKNMHQIKFFLKSIYKDFLANPILSFWNRPQMEPDGPLWELFIWPKYAPRARNTDSTSCFKKSSKQNLQDICDYKAWKSQLTTCHIYITKSYSTIENTKLRNVLHQNLDIKK